MTSYGYEEDVVDVMYTVNNWNDLLTSYNGNPITYDEIGNPLTLNGYTLTWEGRRLTGMTMNAGQFGSTYEYNDDGIRTSKTVSGVKHTYYLAGSQIEAEAFNNTLLIYIYDAEGAPIGLQYRTSNMVEGDFDTFWFEKNLQGDITAVYTESGVKIGTYTYDAWGVCTAHPESSASTVQKHIVRTYNPFRYRGYYYDTDTGLYYLQSRYYDSNTGRFINADTVLDPQSIIGNNIFAYCLNNPINMVDSSGMAALALAGGGAVAAGWAIGGSNIWNPVGWVIIGAVVVTTVVVVGTAIYANSSSKSSTQSSTRTKTLSDVKTRKQYGKHYQLAYISDYGCLIRVGKKMDFASALAVLGISGATNSINQRYQYNKGKSSDAQRQLEHLGKGEWGIYADTQYAAKALAVVLGYSGMPEVHGSDMYGHYHDSTHTFHIWYGGILTY